MSQVEAQTEPTTEGQTMESQETTPPDAQQDEILLEEVPQVNVNADLTSSTSRNSEMSVHDYSDKSFVVSGEATKTYKNQLRELGGKFNRNLRTGPGWIFSKKSQEKVMEFLMSVQGHESESSQSSPSIPNVNASTGLPEIPKTTLPNNNKFRWVKYKIFQPSEGMKIILKTKSGNTNGRVVQTESSQTFGNNQGVIDKAYVEFEGSTSMAVFCCGKWQIFGYFEDHTLYFQ